MNKSDKVKHVLEAPDTGDHHCHWPGCKKKVKPAFWGCFTHWMKLPAWLRAKVWAAYKPSQEIKKNPSREYLEVAEEVQKWIREHHPKG